LLERIQDDLPNFTALVGDRFYVARPIRARPYQIYEIAFGYEAEGSIQIGRRMIPPLWF
jgi:hypothetical protein